MVMIAVFIAFHKVMSLIRLLLIFSLPWNNFSPFIYHWYLYDSWNNIPCYKNSNGKDPCEAVSSLLITLHPIYSSHLIPFHILTVGTTFLVTRTLMEKALLKPNWLVTTRITPTLSSSENYHKIINDFHTAKKIIS